jgi:hypothetical protein
MKKHFFLVLIIIELLFSKDANSQRNIDISVSVLAIGHSYYDSNSIFHSYSDINYSAEQFLNCFKSFSTPCIMEASPDKHLSKKKILDGVKSFVDFVTAKKSKFNLGIIYYCGHGVADLSGSMYFVPGNISFNTEKDTSFEYLTAKLLNVDEFSQLIIKAQKTKQNQSQFIILGDCCSDKISSKIYKGIGFRFSGDSSGYVSYDSSFLSNINNSNSTLRASALAYTDSAGNIKVPSIDSSKPIINEFSFMPELIRSNTMKKNGNLIIYSSLLGNSVSMVAPPGNSSLQDVGPICRRTLLYFKNISNQTLKEYFIKLTDKDYDKITSPSLVDRGRNY